MAKKAKKIKELTEKSKSEKEITAFTTVACHDLKEILKSSMPGEAVRSNMVFENLERQIGREKALKLWPVVCKHAQA